MTGSADDHDGGRWNPRNRLEALLFGDRYGLLLFLSALAFFGLYWRLDVFMTDSITVVNGLGALGNGHVGIQSPVLGSSLDTPGMHLVGGEAVARNYGEIVLALPILVVLRGVSMVANLHVALMAAWHLVLLGLVYLGGPRMKRDRLAIVGGSAIVLLSFLANLLVARGLPAFAPVTASLGILTLIAAGMSVVICYRLVETLHGRRLGLFAGGILAVASPLAFWATFPKRHVFTGLAVLFVLFFVHRSRAVSTMDEWSWGIPRSAVLRGLAYGTIGLYAWVHAGEALFLLIALTIVDVPTAPAHDVRTYAGIAVIFGLSLLPMVLTNLALSGNPVKPPRLLPAFDPAGLSNPETTGDSRFLPGGGGRSGSGFILLEISSRAIEMSVTGVETLSSDHGRVYHTYIRSRSLAERTLTGGGGQLRYAAANLSYLESLPLAGGLVAGITFLAANVRSGVSSVARRLSTTDILAIVLAITFAVLYADSLPLHAQYTVRYLFPLFPLAIYGLARLSPTRQVLSTDARLGRWSAVVTVLVGGQLLFAFVVVRDLAVSEAFQLHALVNLGLAAVLAVTLSLAAVRPTRTRPAAIALGVTAGATTVFILMSGIVYFPIGRYLLPVVEVLVDLIAAA